MSEFSKGLDEVADRSETRLREIHSVISDLKFCLYDYVHNVHSTGRTARRRDQEAMAWMEGALEDITATVTGLHLSAGDAGPTEGALTAKISRLAHPPAATYVTAGHVTSADRLEVP